MAGPDRQRRRLAEAHRELDLGLASAGLLDGDVAETLEPITPLDAPRPDAKREVQDPTEQDREEELREAVRTHRERGLAAWDPEAHEHRDVPGVDITEPARRDGDRGEHVGDPERDDERVDLETRPERPDEHPQGGGVEQPVER